MEKVIWKKRQLLVNDHVWMTFDTNSAAEQVVQVYKGLELAYPKFYKMDILSKVGYLCSELLLKDKVLTHSELSATATFLSTAEGCREVDIRFLESTGVIPSPALFVYTLPNIMLGEICIRHKLKGEQICYIAPAIDREDLNFYLEDIFRVRGLAYCLCGHVNVLEDTIEAEVYWIDKRKFTRL